MKTTIAKALRVSALMAGLSLVASPVAAKSTMTMKPLKVTKDADARDVPKEVRRTLTAVKKKGPTIYDFEDDTIRGTLTKPESEFVDSRRRAKGKSLIKIRQHFVPELLRSVDHL